MLMREDARRKCGEMVVAEKECERGEGRGEVNGMERKWRKVREVRKVKMEEGREERLLEKRYGGREG